MIINKPDDYQVKDKLLTCYGSLIKNNLQPQEIPIIEDLNMYGIDTIDLDPKNPNFVSCDYRHTTKEMETLIKLLVLSERKGKRNFNNHIRFLRLDILFNSLKSIDLNLNLSMQEFLNNIQKMEGIPDKFNDYIDYEKLLRAYQNLQDCYANTIYIRYELFTKDNPDYPHARFIIYTPEYDKFCQEFEKLKSSL